MTTQNRRWTRDELVIVFYLYCQTPFGKMHKSNPDVIQTARLIGRTPSSVAMKLVNFASLDPAITSSGRAGLGNASAGDRAIWDQFHDDWEGLADEAERLREGKLAGIKALDRPGIVSEDEDFFDNHEGETKEAIVHIRKRQSFFRRAVLSSYQGRCCISGVSEPKLLVASHIVPWSEDKANRLNPRNGLCLSTFHDRAFDQFLITITPDYKVKVSRRLKEHHKNPMINSTILEMSGRQIFMPEKFWPAEEFLRWHSKKFDGQQ